MALNESEVDELIQKYLAASPRDENLAEVIRHEIGMDREIEPQVKPEPLPEDDGRWEISHRLPALIY